MSDGRQIPVEGLHGPGEEHLLGDIAKALGAELVRGDERLSLSGFATLASAGPSDISFVATPKAAEEAAHSKAGAFAAPAQFDVPGRPLLRVPEIWDAVCKLIAIFRPSEPLEEGIDPTARINSTAVIGAGVAVGPNAIVGARAVIGAGTVIGAGCMIGRRVRIGKDCLIYPGVNILHSVSIGDRVIIHPGAVIGSDGFKYEVVGRGLKKIPQAGTVVIEDDVEIGSNAAIDRAFLDETHIGAGTKIDNLVQIAHNVRIGRNCIIIAQVGISGSTVLGDNCILAGKVGVRDNVRIGNNVQIGALSGVKDDIPDNTVAFGYPSLPIGEWARNYAAMRRGPETLKRLRSFEKRLEALEGKSDSTTA